MAPSHRKANFQSFWELSEDEQRLLALVAKNINEDDERVQSLINCFRSLDVDHSGTLSRDQLLQGFESAGTPISGEDLDKLLANSSEESVKNGTIDFTLWLSSTLGRAALRADDHADATFHALNLHHEAELDSALFTGGCNVHESHCRSFQTGHMQGFSFSWARVLRSVFFVHSHR